MYETAPHDTPLESTTEETKIHSINTSYQVLHIVDHGFWEEGQCC